MKIARKRGYKCLAAGDGKTGLVLAVEEPVTAILLDLKLPDIDGIRCLISSSRISGRAIFPCISSAAARKALTRAVAQGRHRLSHQAGREGGDRRRVNQNRKLLQSEVKQLLVVEDDKNTPNRRARACCARKTSDHHRGDWSRGAEGACRAPDSIA